MSKNKIKEICYTGIGIALFVVLSLCLRVPVFENYYLCLGYIVMMVYLYSVDTFSGTIVGVLGTVLYCILINGLRGMPGWVLANIFIGIYLGKYIKIIKEFEKENNRSKHTKIIVDFLLFAMIFVITAAGILIIKSMVEALLYTQIFMIRVFVNVYAFWADVIVLIVSIPICRLLDPHIRKILHN